MTVEKIHTEQEKIMGLALAKIQELCRPGQELYHSQCIDIMSDCYNLAKEATAMVVK